MDYISYSAMDIRRANWEISSLQLLLGDDSDTIRQKQTFEPEEFTDEIDGITDQILAENVTNPAKVSLDYNCDSCGKIFRKCKNLKIHVKTIHQGIKQSCQVCTKEFCNKEDLKTHMKRVHEGDQNYNKCPTCRKPFSRPGNLHTHIKSVHEKRKDQKCDYCIFYSSRKDALKKHIETVNYDIVHML